MRLVVLVLVTLVFCFPILASDLETTNFSRDLNGLIFDVVAQCHFNDNFALEDQNKHQFRLKGTLANNSEKNLLAVQIHLRFIDKYGNEIANFSETYSGFRLMGDPLPPGKSGNVTIDKVVGQYACSQAHIAEWWLEKIHFENMPPEIYTKSAIPFRYDDGSLPEITPDQDPCKMFTLNNVKLGMSPDDITLELTDRIKKVRRMPKNVRGLVWRYDYWNKNGRRKSMLLYLDKPRKKGGKIIKIVLDFVDLVGSNYLPEYSDTQLIQMFLARFGEPSSQRALRETKQFKHFFGGAITRSKGVVYRWNNKDCGFSLSLATGTADSISRSWLIKDALGRDIPHETVSPILMATLERYATIEDIAKKTHSDLTPF